ncbi:TPA: hypothetical protein ENG04_11010 [Candidatus Poribacteria bacterium]|nr:hypothetical protein [Candidatus Poribacteria bacterium]HEX30597.1 hypothetical protein [Candidatus Poribacteria bacterium]
MHSEEVKGEDDLQAITIIPFCESLIMEGDHAGVSETSLMLYLDKEMVDMKAIGEENYRDHGWSERNAPEKATAAKGEGDVERIITYLKGEIEKALGINITD